MTMNGEQLREEFEGWAANRWQGANFSPDQNNCGIVVPERYKHPKLQAAWEAYQAGRAALQSQPTNVELIGYVEPLYVECRKRGLPLNSKVFASPTKEATKAVYSSSVTTMQSQHLTVDALAQEIRRANGNHTLGAGALAEALMPFLESALQHSCKETSQDREDAADMFWDADDTEDCLYAYDEETAVEQMVERAWPTDFPLHFTLQRAVRLPDLNIKVTSMSDCGTDIQYERDAIAHARRIEGDR